MILRGIVAGAVLAVLGVALLLVPIAGQGIIQIADTNNNTGSQSAGSNSPATFYEPSVTPAAISFTVSWAWEVPVIVSVYSCGTDTSCAAGPAHETPSNLVAQGTAEVGSLTFNGVAGYGYEVYANSTISVTIAYNGPLWGGFPGLLFLIIGIIVLIAGAAVPAGGLRPPSSVKDSVLRQPGEMFRWYWNGSWDGAPGGLLLSNLRLVLLDRQDTSGGSHFSTRETIMLVDLVAVEPAASSYGAGQLALKKTDGASRTFVLEGKFTAARAARAIQRASLVQHAGTKKGGVARAGPTIAGGAAGAPVLATAPQEPGQVIYKEREVIREVVRIPCRYCGQLNDQLSVKCSGCGSPTGRI
jgi:hypothetical protein